MVSISLLKKFKAIVHSIKMKQSIGSCDLIQNGLQWGKSVPAYEKLFILMQLFFMVS